MYEEKMSVSSEEHCYNSKT